jgi:hypothetical protein
MMAQVSETLSLEEIEYKSKVKIYLLVPLVLIFFLGTFINFYPIGDKLKSQLQKHLSGSGCNPDFKEIRMEWLMPKIIVTDLLLPAACLNRMGEPLKFNFVTLNWHIINFSPLGLPFKLDTEIYGQQLQIYYVLGINQQLVRLKDQSIVLSRLEPLLGESFKMGGTITMDLLLLMSNNLIKDLSFKGQSKDLTLPLQNIEGFTIPTLKVNEFYLEANSTNHPRVNIEKFIIGDPDSPIRANFKGRIDLQERNIGMSPVDLSGEVAFS